MRVPAQYVTAGMVTRDNGVVLTVDRIETDTPVVINGDHGISLHTREDMIEVTHGVYRVQYWDHIWGGFRDAEIDQTYSAFTTRKSRAVKAIKTALERGGVPRKYRIVDAEGKTVVYRKVGSRILTGTA